MKTSYFDKRQLFIIQNSSCKSINLNEWQHDADMCYIGASVFTSDTVERSFWPSFTFTLASCCSGQPGFWESSTPNTYTWQTQNTCRGIKSCCSYRRAVTQWQHLCGTKVHCRLHSNRARTTQTGSINVSSIETPTQQDVKKQTYVSVFDS